MIEHLLHVRVDEEIGGCVLSGLDEDRVSLGNPDRQERSGVLLNVSLYELQLITKLGHG
jgi:hypothetical protein